MGDEHEHEHECEKSKMPDDEQFRARNCTKKKSSKKMHTYLAPVFIGTWIALYLGVVLARINTLPKAVHIEDEKNAPERFVAERARSNLEEFTAIGPRVSGSYENDVLAVRFIVSKINEIIEVSRKDLYDIEVDVQNASGGYHHRNMLNTYSNIKNVVVKFAPKNSNTSNGILVNTHFDTVPLSPGGGDDGSMVVISIEVIRKLATSEQSLQRPLIFLFNGAEENQIQGSHAFITQHKWANIPKAFINLDACGIGSNEILFQSAPKAAWIMKYYMQGTKRGPRAQALAEEIFQTNLIPSDTDFRVFRDFGNLPGLDMAFYRNGYQYHTEYDTAHSIPAASLQSVGDNVLGITRALANASELDNVEEHQSGSVVFYDLLGYKLIFYTKSQGDILNISVSVITLLTILVSLRHIAENSGSSFLSVFFKFIGIQVLQTLALVFAIGLAVGVTHLVDYLHITMSWYGREWMVVPLYSCVVLFGMGIVPALYLSCTKNDRVSLSYKVQMFAHAQCILLILILMGLTYFNIRSAYVLLIAVFFYGGALLFNLITTLHNRDNYWLFPTILGQIAPFCFYTYFAYTLLATLIPMKGRSGITSNPDEHVCALTTLFTILSGGFMIHVVHLFKRSKCIIVAFLVITVLAILFASTPSGVPFKAKVSAQRFYIVHSSRNFRNATGAVRRSEPAYYIYPQDRRTYDTLKLAAAKNNNVQIRSVAPECTKEMACGFPYIYPRMVTARRAAFYVPATEGPILPSQTKFELVSKIESKDLAVVKYTFKLTGTSQMTLIIQPTAGSRLIDWSFPKSDYLSSNRSIPFYYVYLASGNENMPHTFSLEFEKTDKVSSISAEFGVAAYWLHELLQRTPGFSDLLASLPDNVYKQNCVASYDTFFF